VARTVALPEPEVFGVATFYTMFNLQPVGRHHLQVCMTLSCSLMGADRLFRHLETRLGIGHGETTPDGRFTLRRVECLAACGGGPCMQVNLDYHENLDEAKADALLKELQ
jgi:NADH-quinone oxidoreductase subunit E